MLDARLELTRGAFRLGVAFTVARGETLVLVGESGAGKTTVLRLLAGLTRPDGGHILVDGETWSSEGTFLPPHARAIGFVAQDDALFPHLSAFDNVAFGLRALRVPGDRVVARVRTALQAAGADAFAQRKPGELSGGQRQRVALARALVLEPRVLLLDEPLSALDPRTRRAVRGELRALLERLPCATVFVTHSPLEALALGDRIAVIENGALAQVGAQDELLLKPRSAYVADFLGVNLFRGTIEKDGAGAARLVSPEGAITLADDVEEGEGFATVSPREIGLALEPPTGSARNVFRGAVVEIAPEPPHGERVRVALDTRPPLVAEVTREAMRTLALAPGQRVYASFKASGVVTYR